ncbi:MAG: LamG domain-containing protein [Roseibacillus sp.]
MLKHSHVLFILALLLLGIHPSWSQVPQLVNLQGRIVVDGAITSAKLGSGAVTSDKIFANAVNSSKLAQDSVGSSEIETDAVGASEIADNAVATGEVELHAGRAPVQSLKTGEAVTIENGGQQQNPVAADPNAFAKLDAFEPQSLREQRARFDRWQAHSRQLRQDPRLIVYYPCDQNGSWQRSLINETGDPERRGAMVGVKRTPGRWPWKGAVEFRRPGDRVRVFIPGEYTSLTLLCWVRLDSVDRMWNSLYLTDGYEKGEVHWQITEEGRLAYSMRVRETGEHRQYLYLSPPFWKSELSGRWIHLATTFDAGKAEVIHYLDGAEIHREKSTPEHVVKTTRFGAGKIGNWGLSLKRTDPEFVIRSLNGLMDEFAIFSGALSGPEIKSMFEAGNPVGR